MSSQPNDQNQSQSKKKKSGKKDSGLKSVARYTGMAFQMMAIILIMKYVGVKLDERRGAETPFFTAVLALLGVIAAIYTVIKDFIKKN